MESLFTHLPWVVFSKANLTHLRVALVALGHCSQMKVNSQSCPDHQSVGAVCPLKEDLNFLTGLKLQGATCNNNKLSLSNAISTVLPLTQLRWVKQTNAEKKANVVSGLLSGQTVPYFHAWSSTLMTTTRVLLCKPLYCQSHFWSLACLPLPASAV